MTPVIGPIIPQYVAAFRCHQPVLCDVRNSAFEYTILITKETPTLRIPTSDKNYAYLYIIMGHFNKNNFSKQKSPSFCIEK